METLVDLLQESAKRYGPRDAYRFKPGFRTQRWSYSQVWEHSGKMAGFLALRGVSKGDRVVLWAPNRPEWALALFGCLRLGVVAVPLDLRSTPDFVQGVVQRTQPKLAFLSRFTPEGADLAGLPVVDVEDIPAIVAAGDQDAPPLSVSGDDLAEIMFTSGTTGDPKGVMLTHRNILSNVQASGPIVPADFQHRLLSLLPLSHMLEQTGGLFRPLEDGSTVAYPTSRQPGILLRTMRENQVTTMLVVPQALQLFMNAIEREVEKAGRQELWNRLVRWARALPMSARRVLFRSVHAQFGGHLRFLVCGGAYLDPALGEKWESLGVMVLQGYGATEASPAITSNTFRERRLDSLGKVLPGQEVRVAPDGEILARGTNITQGYWQNPGATAEVFEGEWYKTGDLGYLDDQGFLYFKGRKKDLIVLANGQNVYPDDIENLLRKQPGVVDAAVVGLPKDGGAVEVHAALILEEGSRAAEVVRTANSQLADHQQVQGFTHWPGEDFPRTHTLKVKKREVLEYLQQHREGSPAPPPPTASVGPTEDPLLRIISGLSSVAKVEILPESTLGGDLNLDSLGRVELLSAIEEELGVYIDDAAVSPDTTVAELEHLIAGSPQRGPGSAFAAWPLHPAIRVLREVFQQCLLFPLYHLLYQVRVTGRERLAGVQPPVLIAANHNFGAGTFGLDPPAAWMALPRGLRLRTCTAGAEDDVFGPPLMALTARLLGNAFPIAREGNVRASLEYVGRLLDLGWSVLIFPEGVLTVGGPMQPFKAGTGLLAVESGTPVMPIKIEVTRNSVIQGAGWRFRGAFTVKVGAPLTFPPGTPYSEATEGIEAAVRAL